MHSNRTILSMVGGAIFLSLSVACSNPLGKVPSIDSSFHPGYSGGPVTVTAVNPKAGSITGGSLITITGTGFLAGATVLVGGSACLNITVASDTKITCTTPSHVNGFVAVQVTNPDTQTNLLANAFDYLGIANPNANFAVVSGGTMSASGTNIKLRATAGTVGNPIIQTGSGANALIGLQGVLAKP